mmetsp:Transcript_41787/g.89045  ORF Transcript_41787/g.89045 Transcript_41787/m.89045 type:complete len:238 (-) Transcript_41787:176-889(-)
MRLSNTPVVTNSIVPPASLGAFLWNRTVYPTELPTFSPLSSATRSATETAAIFLGCVTTISVLAPRPDRMASSSMYCGHCVDFPLPVPPDTTTTCSFCSAPISSSRILTMGSASRRAFIFPFLPSGFLSDASIVRTSSSLSPALMRSALVSLDRGRRPPPLRLSSLPPAAAERSKNRASNSRLALSCSSILALCRPSNGPTASIISQATSYGRGGIRSEEMCFPGEASMIASYCSST